MFSLFNYSFFVDLLHITDDLLSRERGDSKAGKQHGHLISDLIKAKMFASTKFAYLMATDRTEANIRMTINVQTTECRLQGSHETLNHASFDFFLCKIVIETDLKKRMTRICDSRHSCLYISCQNMQF